MEVGGWGWAWWAVVVEGRAAVARVEARPPVVLLLSLLLGAFSCGGRLVVMDLGRWVWARWVVGVEGRAAAARVEPRPPVLLLWSLLCSGFF